MAKSPRCYWDSCVFIAYLAREEDKGPNALAHMDQMMAGAQLGKLTVITSVLWRIEVNLLDKPREACGLLEEAFRQGFFIPVSVSDRIARLGGEIHRATASASNETNQIDALHVATALDNDCAILYTFDKRLLNLQGRLPGGATLRIRKPDLAQGSLF